jgi:hypothetical protein
MKFLQNPLAYIIFITRETRTEAYRTKHVASRKSLRTAQQTNSPAVDLGIIEGRTGARQVFHPHWLNCADQLELP